MRLYSLKMEKQNIFLLLKQITSQLSASWFLGFIAVKTLLSVRNYCQRQYNTDREGNYSHPQFVKCFKRFKGMVYERIAKCLSN